MAATNPTDDTLNLPASITPDLLLVRPSLSLRPDGQPTAAPHDLLAGRYRLGIVLSTDSLGTVYAAEQATPVVRPATIRIVRVAEGVASVRFESERPVLAQLDHPAIAKLYETGHDGDGKPFFATERIAGLAVTRYCDGRRLTIRQRVELFVPICRAVQHAHQKGIIHRDLKPSHLLVGETNGKAEPHVTDFGVAGAAGLDATDADTRADLFALGAVLHELLTGEAPPEKPDAAPKASAQLARSPDTLKRRAAERSIAPGQLAGILRGDLDAIVARCLEPDRERRYAAVSELANDLGRYLSSQPVSAAPSSRGMSWSTVAVVVLVWLATVAASVAGGVALARVLAGRTVVHASEAEISP